MNIKIAPAYTIERMRLNRILSKNDMSFDDISKLPYQSQVLFQIFKATERMIRFMSVLEYCRQFGIQTAKYYKCLHFFS